MPEWDSCQLVDDMLSKNEIKVKHGHDSAAYIPKDDLIRLPSRQAFESAGLVLQQSA